MGDNAEMDDLFGDEAMFVVGKILILAFARRLSLISIFLLTRILPKAVDRDRDRERDRDWNYNVGSCSGGRKDE
jgi:hypothetical protein